MQLPNGDKTVRSSIAYGNRNHPLQNSPSTLQRHKTTTAVDAWGKERGHDTVNIHHEKQNDTYGLLYTTFLALSCFDDGLPAPPSALSSLGMGVSFRVQVGSELVWQPKKVVSETAQQASPASQRTQTSARSTHGTRQIGSSLQRGGGGGKHNELIHNTF